jgi:hypothetical protein
MEVCKYQNCEVTDLIMKYLEPLMQLLSVNITDYNMKLKTTKCLNTAIMLTYLLGGYSKLKETEYCLVENINNRYQIKEDKLKYKLDVFDKLKKDLERKNIKKRYFYYILMTNNEMQKSKLVSNSNQDTAFFPGHVFIIDKYPYCTKSSVQYKIYQSYINQYDLKGHYRRNKNTMKLENNNVDFLLNGIHNIVSNEVWNDNAVEFWKKLTFVDTKKLINYKTNKINLCYSKIRIDHCYKTLQTYIKNSIYQIENDIKSNNLNKYNVIQDDYNTFKVKQLSIYGLKDELNKLYRDLTEKLNIYGN